MPPRHQIRTNVGEDAGAHVAARRRLELTFDDVVLRVSHKRAGA